MIFQRTPVMINLAIDLSPLDSKVEKPHTLHEKSESKFPALPLPVATRYY